MTTRSRNSLLIGATFVLIGIGYAVLSVPLGYHLEWAGATLLPALGVALGIMAYVLSAGSSD